MKGCAVVFAVTAVASLCTLGTTVHAQVDTVKSDTASYGRTPWEYRPYNRFEKAYKEFFLDVLEYHGYGRHIPEPEHVETVKIGFVGPIIGSVSESLGGPEDIVLRVNQRQIRWDGYQASHLAPLGIKMLQGARLAVEQANARGGYRGRIPYQLVIRNDNGNWRSSGREVITLAYQDSVWAILGTVDGANSHIAIRAALKAEIVVMNTADTDPTFVETAIPWVFRNITDDRQMCYLLADFAFKKLRLQRVAALRAVNRYGRMSIDEFRDAATRLGNPFMVELEYQEGDTDFRPQLERIKSLDVDGVITYGNSRESALLLKQMRDMGMNQWFLGSDRMVTQEFRDIVGASHGNVAAGFPYDPTSTDPRYLRFAKEFRAKYGEDPETYAAHAYDGINMLIEAIERAGLNRALIRDELAAMKEYLGVTGPQEFDPVFSDRSPAVLAILRDGRFEFYSREEALSDKMDFGSPRTP
ncbi:MAG: ABC transporter substrate-binding protein [Gemmatimonadales bacterium]|nr:ABC transporter substrate-binding protein [Gemmatimonadales bacterium]NIN12168.1 ABC transporter substrate-binding protein [Gemmatimonadales bacterium]NIN50589.1 ABC transporter substrate-binding protein [Gemmatimonadales bacterium]NIP08053.1 ABC transporter substrate-binding protein [Gemmatimonadales bacterium]NIR00635.1 ABC transporter substrate-binding protein [Gemmatimonadales bacterium]